MSRDDDRFALGLHLALLSSVVGFLAGYVAGVFSVDIPRLQDERDMWKKVAQQRIAEEQKQ